MTSRACWPSKPQIALGLDSLIGLICSLLHTRRAIDESINEYPIAPVSSKAVVLISLLLPSIHKATNVVSVKKSPGKLDDDTINGFIPSLLTTLAEVRRFLTGFPVFVLFAPPVSLRN